MWNNIKSILKDSKTKCVIIEDGKPAYVVIPFDEYCKLQKLGDDGMVRENYEGINADIQGMMDGDEIPSESAALKLEDLPF